MFWTKDAASVGSNLDVRRLAHIYRDAAMFVCAACLVASCASPYDLLRLGSWPDAQGSALYDVGQMTYASQSEVINPIVDPPRSEPSPQSAEAASPAPPNTEASGVGFKRGRSLAEIKRHLAQLLRTGAIVEVFDSKMTDSTSTGELFVQIGSHQLRSAAEGQLGATKMTLASTISGFGLRVRSADLPSQGRFFRVQIGPISSQGAALDLCRALQTQRQSCFTVAEKAPAPVKPSGDIALRGEWASIGPSEVSAGLHRAERPETERASATTSQVADAVPVYTLPGMPGLPE